MKKKLALLMSIALICLTGCGAANMAKTDLKGTITGNTYTIDAFNDYGELELQLHGDNIGIQGVYNTVRGYSGEAVTKSYELSSVLRLTIDGKDASMCGNTLIFYEDGLVPDVNFELQKNIDSTTDGSIDENVIIAGAVNKVKNLMGKPMVVVIQSELGQPIHAFSGNKVTVNVPDNLPKFTKLNIDGKALYIHRCDYMILDKTLLN